MPIYINLDDKPDPEKVKQLEDKIKKDANEKIDKMQSIIKNAQDPIFEYQKKAFEATNNLIKNAQTSYEEIEKRKYNESQALMKNNVYSAADEMLKTAQLESNIAGTRIKEMEEKVLKDEHEKISKFASYPAPVFPKKNNNAIEKNIPFIIKEEQFPENERKTDQKLYKCFVIMPIGEKGTQEYLENIKVFENIIKKSVKSCGYNIECYHADLINDPGSIPEQIISSLENDAIVVADLRRNNPNVIWELGVRHTFQKRSIMIFSQTKEAFFDTQTYRMARYHIDGESNIDFCKKIHSFIDHIITNPIFSDNPVWDIKKQNTKGKSSSYKIIENPKYYKYCPECRTGINLEREEKFCNCGTQYLDKCPQCKENILSDRSMYCRKCGYEYEHKPLTGHEWMAR